MATQVDWLLSRCARCASRSRCARRLASSRYLDGPLAAAANAVELKGCAQPTATAAAAQPGPDMAAKTGISIPGTRPAQRRKALDETLLLHEQSVACGHFAVPVISESSCMDLPSRVGRAGSCNRSGCRLSGLGVKHGSPRCISLFLQRAAWSVLAGPIWSCGSGVTRMRDVKHGYFTYRPS